MLLLKKKRYHQNFPSALKTFIVNGNAISYTVVVASHVVALVCFFFDFDVVQIATVKHFMNKFRKVPSVSLHTSSYGSDNSTSMRSIHESLFLNKFDSNSIPYHAVTLWCRVQDTLSPQMVLVSTNFLPVALIWESYSKNVVLQSLRMPFLYPLHLLPNDRRLDL